MHRILFLVYIFISLSGLAQGFSYWANQYGVRASFLGGAAVGSVLDNSSIYYNPASLGFVDGGNLSVSANTFSLRFIRVEDGLGNNLDLNTTAFTILPQLISGMIDLKKTPKLKLGYILMAKESFNHDYTLSYNGQENYVDSVSGNENFFTTYQSSHKYNEIWAGATVAYNVNPIFSVGCSFFISFIDERVINNLSFRVIPSGSQSNYISLRSNYDFSYWNFKGIFKPSLAISKPRFRWGLSGTIPSFNFYGEAKANREVEVLNFPQFQGVDFLFTDQQKKIKTKTRFSGSISTGMGLKIGKGSWLHISGEYFFPQEYYLLFNPDNQVVAFPQGITEEQIDTLFGLQNFLAYGERRKQVVNAGIGWEQRINDKLELMFGFRTDFNFSFPEDRHVELEHMKKVGAIWNNYYGSAGVSFWDKKGKHYSVGVELGFTPSGTTVQYIDLSNPNIYQFYSAERREGKLQDYNVKLIFGIELNWKKKCSDCPAEDVNE
ncbi:MAG: hypothetical protein KDC84_07665 [Crocinitomicaceae bacterium]|nr:hypothetical protein [Crocinitomicaceae bacterium]